MRTNFAYSMLVAIAVQLLCMQSATAAPVKYEISGTLLPITFSSSSPQYPAPVGTPYSASFFYDSTLPLQHYPATAAYGVATNLSGSFGGHEFSSPTGSFEVVGGVYGLTFRPSDGFVGPTLNGLTLVEMGIAFSGTFNGDVLPENLSTLPFLVVSFNFSNGQGIQQFLGSGTISEVPLPPAAALFGTGIFGLISVRRRLLK